MDQPYLEGEAFDLLVNVSEAKGRLSELVNRALAGERVAIAHGGEPVIDLTPRKKRRRFGALRELMPELDVEAVAQQIDTPWTEEELALFEGEDKDTQ